MRSVELRAVAAAVCLAGLFACSTRQDGLPQGPGTVRTDGGGSKDTSPDGPRPSVDAAPPAADGPAVPPPDAAPAGCNPGFHPCGAVCVDSRAPATCGNSCEPCPAPTGGSATCDGIKCGVTCPAGQKPCLTACIAADAPCDNICPAGKNNCNGLCVEATSLAACGPGCMPCPTSPGGTSSCDGTTCTLTCNAGFHRCAGACKADDDPAACGASCTPCPVPAGARATCTGGGCGFACVTGRPCGNACIPDAQTCNGACATGFRNCNGTCMAVSALPAETCDGKDNDCDGAVDEDITPRPCDPACAGQQRCAGGRWDDGGCARVDSDPRACGDSCRDCPAPSGSTPVCRMGSCDFACDGPRLKVRCGNACCECTTHGHCPPNNVCTAMNLCLFQAPVIMVVHGLYGRNCPGNTMADKTADLAAQCNGRPSCAYKVDYTRIGDPAPGCAKQYEAAWRCTSGATVSPVRTAIAPAEAGRGSIVTLTCP
jgi:hypothetical protein